MRKDPEKERQKAALHATHKHASMLRRCVSHDYSAPGMYLLTLTTEGRRPLFGHLEGDTALPPGHPGAPRTVLSELGRAVEAVMLAIPTYHPEVAVTKLQMMPDHLHLVLHVGTLLPKTLGEVVRGAKIGCNKAYRAMTEAPSYRGATPLPRYDQWDPEHPNRPHGQLFAPGYNDRLLKDEGQLHRWLAYLYDNPRRAIVKREHPEYFRVQRNVMVAGLSLSAIGNLFLLHAPAKTQVQCSRRLTPAEVEALQATVLA